MFCHSCGTRNQGSKFCTNCGANLGAFNMNQGYKTLLYDKFSLLLYILLSILTFGIYPLIILYRVIKNINIAATPYDSKTTPNLLTLIVLSIITFGIYSLVFFHKLSNRAGNEARRRGMYTSFGAKDFWIWNILLAFIFGSLVYYYKLFEVMNYISRDYNSR